MTLHTKTTLTAVATTVFSLLSASAVAKSSAPEDIETLTITGTRLPVSLTKLPASVSVLTEQDIAASGAFQLTDLLRGLPGVSLAQSGSPGGLSEVRVRGSESNHLLVLIDGVVVNDIGQSSVIDLSHLTIANIERIELLKGPQSAMWGSGAIGGVLSITTKGANNAEQTPSADISAGIGTQGSYQGSVNIATQADDFSLRAYANYLKTEGDNISRLGNEDDGYDNMTVGLNLGYNINNSHRISATLRNTGYQNEYDPIDFVTTGLPVDGDNITDADQVTAQFGWSYDDNDSAYKAKTTLNYHQDDIDNSTDGAFTTGSTGERIDINHTSFYRTTNWQLAAGGEYLQRFYEQRGLVVYGDPNQRRHDTTTSVFVEANGDLTESLFTTLSARYDDNSEFDNAFTYRAGLTWQLNRHYALFSSVGKAVKAPTFTELYGYFPSTFVGNPDLLPEQSEEWEIGVKARWQDASLQVSAYSAQLEDEINGSVYLAEQQIFTAANVDSESNRNGVDIEAKWDTQWATLSAGYSYLDADQTSFGVETTELRRPRHQGSLSLYSNLGTERFSVYAKLAYTGTHFDTFYPPYPALSQTIALSAYTLGSVNIGYKVSELWQLSLKVNNVFDTEYEDIVGFAGQEQRAMLTASYHFQ
ncbi:TonB-dependent receptor [Alteromonas sp. 345S023]|uniref:TonB-dependent receptor n=1 Tax=Alteromonas profundi TaxID=2696062 RepID=A0A7X5LLG6_9ALTE|nr:TonB-dependent receptor [Alteromonas profundi]NDV91538.1 TonB-dependent receptor [Alteromonas profundi]